MLTHLKTIVNILRYTHALRYFHNSQLKQTIREVRLIAYLLIIFSLSFSLILLTLLDIGSSTGLGDISLSSEFVLCFSILTGFKLLFSSSKFSEIFSTITCFKQFRCQTFSWLLLLCHSFNLLMNTVSKQRNNLMEF